MIMRYDNDDRKMPPARDIRANKKTQAVSSYENREVFCEYIQAWIENHVQNTPTTFKAIPTGARMITAINGNLGARTLTAPSVETEYRFEFLRPKYTLTAGPTATAMDIRM